MEKWERLYQNQRVRDWIMTYQSKETQRNYLRSLSIVEGEGLDLNVLLDLEPIEARNRIWEIIQRLLERGQSNYANSVKYATQSLYNFYHEERPLTWNRRIHRVPSPLKKANIKEIPSHVQVWRMIDSARTLRDKAILALMYNTGLGHQAICNLDYGDVIKTLEKNTLPYEIMIDSRIYPKRFRVNTGATSYMVFFDRDCGELLRLYLRDSREQREQSSKILKVPIERTPLFLMKSHNVRRGMRLRPWDLWWIFNEIVRKHGETMSLFKGQTWSYLLRDAFYNRLIEGGMKDIHREALMGHSLGIRNNYYRANSKELKEQYLACNFNRTEPIEKRIEESEIIKALSEENRRLKEALSPDKITELIREQLKQFTSKQLMDLEQSVRIAAHGQVLNRFAKRTRVKS